MSELLLTGVLLEILEKESGKSKAGKDWESQSIVIDTGDEYNPKVCFKFFGKNVSKLENLTIGSMVEVGFNVSSREFNGKWYHNLDGWKIKEVTQAVPTSQNEPANLSPEEDDDDLPF